MSPTVNERELLMRMKIAHMIVALAALSLALGGAITGQAATSRQAVPVTIHFAPSGVVLPHVLVTAMTIRPDGTIYAGGRYLIPINDPHATPPVLIGGSVWAVSHDHGAHWVEHISSMAQTPPNTTRWRSPALWPDAFTANSIAVDPTTPRIIYVAGCMSDQVCAGSSGGHYLLHSVDGGQTWHDALVFSRMPTPHGNIVVTPLLRQVLRRGGTQLTQGYGVVVDPHNGKRVYACVSGLGILRSDDGAHSWHYASQPLWLNGHCELFIDSSNTKVVYSLDRENGILYRTTDGGASWIIRSRFAQYQQAILPLSRLTLLGRALYMTGRNGIYASSDGGAHWRLAIKPPSAGVLGTSIRGVGGWVTVFVPRSNAQPEGLYAIKDGGTWDLAAATDLRGPRYYGSLDINAYGSGLARAWEDHTVRVWFTTGQLGSLYRWSGSL